MQNIDLLHTLYLFSYFASPVVYFFIQNIRYFLRVFDTLMYDIECRWTVEQGVVTLVANLTTILIFRTTHTVTKQLLFLLLQFFIRLLLLAHDL